MASKFALVIANTEYQDASFAKLTAPSKDAEEFAQILQDQELAAFDDVQVLLNEGEGKTRRAIARFFTERKPADLLLLYFSGHGVRNDQGQLFLATNDTEISILEATGIPAEFITRAMNNSRSQRQLLILDCCNSGAFAHGSKSISALGKSMGIATAFEGDGYGRVVLTATDATQFAWEGDKVIGDTQKSVFTHFLIEGLKGDADRNGDGRIHVDELYDYAYEQVVRRTPKQTPGKWSYRQQGDLILRENLKPRDVKPVPLPPDLLDLLSHPNPGVRKVGVQDLTGLLEGKHLGLARAAEEKLREIAQNDDSFTLRQAARDTLIARGITLEQSIETPKEILAGPKAVPVEVLKKDVREEKKIDKPARKTSSSVGDNKQSVGHREAVKEKALGSLPNLKTVTAKLKSRLAAGIAGGLLIMALLVWGGAKLFQNLPAVTAESTHTVQANVPIASQPSATIPTQTSKTDTPSPTRTAIPLTQTAMPSTFELGIGSTMISEKDGMTLLYVPAGEFMAGSDSHKTTLEAFWIDKTEVTNAMYAKCVNAGRCVAPSYARSDTRDSYYGNSEFDNYPVVYVRWKDALAYCSWANRHVPTGLEWEKAARGTDGREYPWGNDGPNDNFLNYGNVNGDTTEVGKYPEGASPYGALDMAGNVFEWVDAVVVRYSWGGKDDLEGQCISQPGECKISGGAWDSGPDSLKIYTPRNYSSSGELPWFARSYIGFRCAMSATQ